MARNVSRTLQLIGSLLVAALIVAITLSVVSSQLPLRELPHEQSEDRGRDGGGGEDHSGPGGG
jgi:hypothetical protein